MSSTVYVSPSEQVEFIFALGRKFEKGKSARSHFSASFIKILYNLYQYHKKYDVIFPGAEKQAKSVSVDLCTKSIYRFVNSKVFHFFGEKVRRDFTSNAYKLHPWVIEVFQNLERFGFMKFFASNFKRWYALWKLQIPRFTVNRLMNISTWDDLYENKKRLCTNRKDRCPTKGEIDVPLLGSKISSQGSLEDGIRETTNPFSKKHEEAISYLKDGLSMREGDLNFVSNYLGLRDIFGGITILKNRISKGWNIKSPIQSFMHCVKEFKNLRKNG